MRTRKEIATIKRYLNHAGGTLFSVGYVDRSGRRRLFNARLHVHKGVKGTGREFHPGSLCVRVYDVRHGWKTLRLDRVRWVRVRRHTIHFER